MSADTFSCPYCCNEVSAQAVVCGHCTRELTQFRPLALQLRALEGQLDALRDDVARLQARALAIATLDLETPAVNAPELRPARAWGLWLGLSALGIALIGLSHWVLLFVYDARPMVLRVLTIVLPMLTGYLCARASGLRLSLQALSAVLVGTLSVVLMLGITALIDHVPLWPAHAHEWRETLEYTAAIVLGSFTGALTHRLRQRLTQLKDRRYRLQALLERDAKGQMRITDIGQQVQSLVSALAPLVSAATALYSGLKIFFGE